ncbi:probable glycerol-3-phosphate acyltransferase 2 [Eucalyptus grandis]|uniref:probable glycerol-3-phosphate acyltransferase 2 n=1 Tax=Eucalyptus grandis TaxID=71139 RepID=UPI00192EC0E5|nr:probable glycerol-3-phosphate acyltransferase 2 [Eucalyptus grandis]
MAGKSMAKSISSFLTRVLFGRTKATTNTDAKPTQRFANIAKTSLEDFSPETIVFDFESTLLRSSSLFPYFMLVAFEVGGFLRALVLLLAYPFVCMLNQETMLHVMVFICFVGVRRESFRLGSAVLPKFFLEELGREAFDSVMGFGQRVAITRLPRVMVEEFLKEWLGVDTVVGREVAVFRGRFTGLMEKNKARQELSRLLCERRLMGSRATCIGCFGKPWPFDHQQLLAHCKEVYMVSQAEKRNWQLLPREKYPKPLIFHDGKLAFRPTPLATLAMFMWLPLGLPLSILRIILGILLPFSISGPVMAMTGVKITVSKPQNPNFDPNPLANSTKGTLYACNHKTLLDPVFVSHALSKPLTAAIYSLSPFNEAISPIQTVRLARDREQDTKLMQRALTRSDLVVCPEGTTCREPYLLRFSPLFARVSKDIVPVAIDVGISMFYGSTARGPKCWDPVFHFMNPNSSYTLQILEKLPASYTCEGGGKSGVEVANYVQSQIAGALGFECTLLTRKDKYMVLAGNDGRVKAEN